MESWEVTNMLLRVINQMKFRRHLCLAFKSLVWSEEQSESVSLECWKRVRSYVTDWASVANESLCASVTKKSNVLLISVKLTLESMHRFKDGFLISGNETPRQRLDSFGTLRDPV